jgi:hypothetical protein
MSGHQMLVQCLNRAKYKPLRYDVHIRGNLLGAPCPASLELQILPVLMLAVWRLQGMESDVIMQRSVKW